VSPFFIVFLSLLTLRGTGVIRAILLEKKDSTLGFAMETVMASSSACLLVVFSCILLLPRLPLACCVLQTLSTPATRPRIHQALPC